MNIQLPLYLFFSLIFTFLPIPGMFSGCWPNWIVLFFFWLAHYRPHSAILLWVWCIGLLLDSLQATFLGVHVLGLLLLSVLIQQYKTKFLLYPVIQQAIWVAIGTSVYVFFTNFFCVNMSFWRFCLYVTQVSVVTGCVWPWIEFRHKSKLYYVQKTLSQ